MSSDDSFSDHILRFNSGFARYAEQRSRFVFSVTSTQNITYSEFAKRRGSHSDHSLSRYCLSSPVQHANREGPALGSPPTLPVCFVRRTRFRPDFVGNDDDLIVFDIHSCDNGISMNTMSPSGSRPSYSPPGEHTFNPRAITTDVRQPSDGEKTERACSKVTAAGQQ